MTGPQALIELLNGKKIRRSIWNDDQFWFLKNNKLCNQDNIIFNMTFNELIIGDDWEIFNSFTDSLKAIEALKNGFKVKHKTWLDDYLTLNNNTIVDSNNNIVNFSFYDLNEKQWLILDNFC